MSIYKTDIDTRIVIIMGQKRKFRISSNTEENMVKVLSQFSGKKSQ